MSDSNSTAPVENKMGTMSLGKLIISMSLPMMISMLVQALYNIVDSIFVAQISEKALTAVSLCFPIQNLIIAVAVGSAVGVNALLSMRLGQKRFDEVNKTAMNSIFIFFVSFLVFIVIGVFAPQAYFESQTNDAEIIEYGVTYLQIVTIVSFGAFGAILFERLLQSTGFTLLSMISQLAGAITNIIFDPIMIFGLLGCPKMGIAGAAWATVLGQIVATIISVTLNLKKNKEIHFSFKGFRPDWTVIKGIYKVGVPSIIMCSIGSIMVYLLNLILGAFTSTAIAVFGVYFKLQSFIFMPVFGLNNGIVPIVAYNYGARKKERITKAVWLCAEIAFFVMLAGTLVFEFLPKQLLGFFNASDEMLSIGIKALRIIALHFPVAAIAITLGSVLQALGQGVQSMVVSIVRQLIVLIPAAWLLSLTGSVHNVWWAFPIAEVLSLIVTIIFMKKCYDKYIKNL